MNRTFKSAVMLLGLFVLGLAASAFGQASWVSLDGTTTPRKPSVTVLSSTDTETVIRINAHGFWVRQVSEDGENFHSLSFPGYATTLDIGKPAIPVVSELVGIPGSANVNMSLIDSKEIILPGYHVYPFQTPLRETEQRVSFDIDRGFYQTSAFYPAPAELGRPGIWRDLRVVNVRVSPLAFNPATGELRACSEITIRLEYTGVSSVNVMQDSPRAVPKNYDQMYRGSVINYSYMGKAVEADVPALMEADGPYYLLIIAADAYLSNVQPLADWKNSTGLLTEIVARSELGNNFASIKEFIIGEYLNNRIRYLLLVGNEDDIPGYPGYGFFSDYYYSLLDGDDDYADIAIGRFSVTNSTEVDNMVNKTITFESNPPAGDWLDKSLLVANWELAPGKYQECKEQVRLATDTKTNTYSVFYPDFTTAYGASVDSGGDDATNADVIAYINSGFRLVNYRGHGGETNWSYWNSSGEYFLVGDVDFIDNGQMTPVVFSIACLNNNLSYPVTTIGEAFTRPNDAAVAYLGASDPSYTYPNHDYDKQLYAAAFDEGINAVGDISNQASVRTISLWGDLGVTNARMYLWLGDPSLQLIHGTGLRPSAPFLVSPAEGAYFDAPASVTLDWHDELLSTTYQVQVDDNSDFSSPLADVSGLTVSQWTTPTLSSDVYYWRVRGANGDGNGMWSRIGTFLVGVVFEAPVLVSPLDGTRIRNTYNIPLEWTQVTGEPDYMIQIDNNADFGSPNLVGYSSDCTDGTCVFLINPALWPGKYHWRVKVAEHAWPYSTSWSFGLQSQPSKDGADAGIPASVELHANYPNPFNPSTGISFGLPSAGHVRLNIYNIMGQKVSTLVDRHLEAGYHTFEWDGTRFASGIYLYRLETQETVATRKMVLLK